MREAQRIFFFFFFLEVNCNFFLVNLILGITLLVNYHFIPFLSFSVGNGKRVKFWHDQWCGDSPLKGAFPALFSIAADKEAAVADLMSIRNGKLHWEVTFARNFQDWEIDALVSFLDLLYSVSLHDSGVDQLC